MFTIGKHTSAVDASRPMTYLRWRVQLPVHSAARAAHQQTSLPTKTLPLQVDVLIWILLLCVDEEGIQCQHYS